MTRTAQLVETTTGRVVVSNLWIADSFWSRLVGLQFRRSLPAGTGLWLEPCGSVHTFFVFFPLDLVAISQTGVVLEVKRRIPPWRLAFFPKGTHSILEMPAGLSGLEVGTAVEVRST